MRLDGGLWLELLYRSFGLIVDLEPDTPQTVMSRATIAVLSDPTRGEGALGRVFTVLAAACAGGGHLGRRRRPVRGADVERQGLPLIAAEAVPGTADLPSLVHHLSDGPVRTFRGADAERHV